MQNKEQEEYKEGRMPEVNGSRVAEIHINSDRVRKFIKEIEAQGIDMEELREYERSLRR